MVDAASTSREGQERHRSARNGRRDSSGAGSRVEDAGEHAAPTERAVDVVGWVVIFALTSGEDRTMLVSKQIRGHVGI